MRMSDEQARTFQSIMDDERWYINGATYPEDVEEGYKTWRMANWLVFDTETTGLPLEDEWERTPNRDFGLIQFFTHFLVNREEHTVLEKRCNPCAPIHEKATEAHGFTDEDVADFPLFEEDAAQTIIDLLESTDVIIAYNARFDIRTLIYEFVMMDMDADTIRHIINIPFIDPLVWERERRGSMSRNQLHDICKRFGVKTMGKVAHGRASLHDANTDTVALVNLMKKYSDTLPWSLMQTVNIQQGHMATQDEYNYNRYYKPKDEA